jgi:hypothetical protein
MKPKEYEELARITLEYYFPWCSGLKSYIDGSQYDNPDLQDPSGHLGIEVVRAISKGDGEMEAFLNKRWRTPITPEEMDKFEKLGGGSDKRQDILGA